VTDVKQQDKSSSDKDECSLCRGKEWSIPFPLQPKGPSNDLQLESGEYSRTRSSRDKKAEEKQESQQQKVAETSASATPAPRRAYSECPFLYSTGMKVLMHHERFRSFHSVTCRQPCAAHHAADCPVALCRQVSSFY
jgi:hypothetical protein